MAVREAILGLDVGGTNLRAALGRPDGQLASGPVRRPVPRDYSALLSTVAELADDLEIRPGQLAAVGVGIPGSADDDGPRWVPALPYLDGTPLGADLGRQLGAPVRFANDAHCTLLAEWDRGAALGVRNAVLVAVGTGIGGALLADGRLVRGATGVAGAFGWLPASVQPDPRHGPWEQVASGAALGRVAAEVGRSGEQLVQSARGGDADARDRLDGFAYALGTGVAALASCLDPEVIVLSGGLSELFDVLEPGMSRAVQDWASPAGRAVRLAPAELGSDAGVIGALLLAGHSAKQI